VRGEADVDASGDDVGLAARYAWAPVPLSADERERAIERCALVGGWARQYGESMRLAFAYRGGTFDAATGAWHPDQGERGLYCSCTVLALFRSVGVELLDRPGVSASPPPRLLPWSPRSKRNTVGSALT